MKNGTSRISNFLGPFLLISLLLAFSACGGGGGNGGKGSPTTNNPTPEEATLECEELGYPCSLTEVPEEIQNHSLLLANEALSMIESGATTAEARAWIAQQEGVIEIISDDLALRFRLEGGRGTWVLRKEALGEAGAPVASSEAPAPLPESPQRFVVGGGTQLKSALVLSPMYWDFEKQGNGSHLDGAQVAGILSDTSGYEGGVTYLFNETNATRTVTLNSFKEWWNHDVIHVDSHGATVCEGAPCRAVIVFSTFLAAAGGDLTDEEKAELTGGSVEVVAVEEKIGAYLGLNADFFIDAYPGGLHDSLVFFNSCKNFSSQATDIADALRGSTSVFLGWNEVVNTVDSNAASKKFYLELAGGVTVQEAYDRLGDLQTDRKGVRLIRSPRTAGGDLRIRDIVYLLNPDTKQVLGPSQEVPIMGEMDDGDPDAVPYLVQVDGILQENAADALLYVSVDGIMPEQPQPVANGSSSGPDQWLVSGEVALPYDVKQATSVSFEAWVELPEGGESRYETTATLTGLLSGDDIVGTWVVDNDTLGIDPQAFILDYISGEIRLTFKGDGSVTVVYDNFGTREYQDDLLNVGGVEIDRHEEFIKTANAQGVTTYEIDGEELSFGQFFESSFVEGTQTVRHIRQFNPDGVIGSSFDETSTRTYRGFGLFAGFKQFRLTASGSTLELLLPNKPPIVLYRSAAAGG